MLHHYLRAIGVAGLAYLLLGAVPAKASLINDTVDCLIVPNGSFWTCSSAQAVVSNPGVEFSLSLVGNIRFNVDIDANSITLSRVGSAGLGLGVGETLTLSDLDWFGMPNGKITDINNLSISGTVTGFDITDIMFTDHSVIIDLDGGSYAENSSISFDLVTNHVPEPGTLAILGLGLAGLGFARRRKVA